MRVNTMNVIWKLGETQMRVNTMKVEIRGDPIILKLVEQFLRTCLLLNLQ